MMELSNIKNVGSIINESYMEDGDFLENLWMDIYNSNLDFELSETFEALILVLRFMVENKIAELIGFDSERKKEITWNGEGDDVLKLLEKYLSDFNEKKIKKNPAFLDGFKYPGYRWKTTYPLELNKYNFK